MDLSWIYPGKTVVFVQNSCIFVRKHWAMPEEWWIRWIPPEKTMDLKLGENSNSPRILFGIEQAFGTWSVGHGESAQEKGRLVDFTRNPENRDLEKKYHIGIHREIALCQTCKACKHIFRAMFGLDFDCPIFGKYVHVDTALIVWAVKGNSTYSG